MKKAVITVLGHDQVGIIAKVCTMLAADSINILDISQTIVGGYFNMVMVVDIMNTSKSFEQIASALECIGSEMGLKVKIQNAEILDAMHSV